MTEDEVKAARDKRQAQKLLDLGKMYGFTVNNTERKKPDTKVRDKIKDDL